MLPVNENKPDEEGWLIKQDKFYLSSSGSSVKAKEFLSVPKAREENENRWELKCE